MSFTCPQCGQPKRGGLSICLACENRPDTKHTAEPWELASDRSQIGVPGAMCQGTHGRSVLPGQVIAQAFNPANATRIVACVNACADGGTLHTLLTRLAGRQMDAAASAQDRVNAADAAAVLRALGG